FNTVASRILYDRIVFTSVGQRDAFLRALDQWAGTAPSTSRRDRDRDRENGWKGTIGFAEKLAGRLDGACRIHDEDGKAVGATAPRGRQPSKDPAVLVRGIDLGFKDFDRIALRPSTTPNPTPNSSAAGTPSNSAPGSPNMSGSFTSLPNSIALGAPAVATIPYGAAWDHRFINAFLGTVSTRCVHITHLCLSGCQFYDTVLAEALSKLPELRDLDVSHSSVKSFGLQAVAESCRRLKRLDVSGVFRFKRNHWSLLVDIATHCRALTRLTALECPDIYEEVTIECRAINPQLSIRWTGWHERGFGGGGGGDGRSL
ncbi:hypothetical protein HK104_007032, partial [Borealophlyctis nickersoniae]